MQISNSKMQYIGSIAYPGAQPLRIFKSPGPGTKAHCTFTDVHKTGPDQLHLPISHVFWTPKTS